MHGAFLAYLDVEKLSVTVCLTRSAGKSWASANSALYTVCKATKDLFYKIG